MTPGAKPASAAPSRKRRMTKLSSLQMQAVIAAMTPQLTMIRAIQSRAPTWCIT